MATIEIPARFAARLRTLLDRADGDPAGPRGVAAWRKERDRWIDILDPAHRMLEPGESLVLLDLLAEAMPSAHSRMTAEEWRSEIEAVTPQLIGLAS